MKTFLLVVFVCIPGALFSQELKRSSIGLSFGFGQPVLFHETLMGGPGYEGRNSYSLGMIYNYNLTGHFTLETGLYWDRSIIRVSSGVPVPPGIETYGNYSVNMLDIPVNMKFKFARIFFMNGGLLVNTDISTNNQIYNQSGIGANLGIGSEIRLFKSFIFSVNPYLNMNGVLLFSYERYPQRLFDSGVRLIIRRDI